MSGDGVIDLGYAAFKATWVHTRSDGEMERLFVRSPERPFHLERDREDGDRVGRLVITFVPGAQEDAGDGGG